MLTEIANSIKQSNFHWTDVAIQIGIDKNDVLKIKERNDSSLEFVHSVTQKIWDEIFHFVGLNLTDNDFTEISSIAKLAAILSGNIVKEIHQEKHVKVPPEKTIKHVLEENNHNVPVIQEISKRISQWREFGRILNLQESFLNQLQTDCSVSGERNHKIMERFSMPLSPNPSWLFWRQYLDEFQDGKLVIEEMEETFIDLLPQIPNTVAHVVTSDRLTYIGHPFHYGGNKDYLTLDKENKLICVNVGSKEYQFVHYQNFSEWVETQTHFMDTYNLFKDLKTINFADEKMCPILQTLNNFLDEANDPGFVMKGYNFVNHFCLFKQGVFAKDIFNDSYFCFLANNNVVLYLTKCNNGACHALHHSLRNVQIANILHGELQSNNITQINIIIHDKTNDYTKFCKQCIDNDLYVNKETFTDAEKFTLWYNKLIANNNIRKKINKIKDVSMTGNEFCKTIKKDMITYQALETSYLPSFSCCPEDQMDELKKLVVLSPNQFKALHSNKKHILLRGSYGCGKSLLLFKKFEQIVNNMDDSDIVYFICNDQQSEFIQYMKILRYKYLLKNIIICRSDQITTKTKIIPNLSFILSHIKDVWKDKTVHVLIDEFSGSYFNKIEIEKLENILHNFQSSYIVIALQSMEQNVVKETVSDFGYQFSKLTKETSFTCFNLDYSLRNSMEVNEFVKATAQILESSKISLAEQRIFSSLDDLIIDSESGMEYRKELNEEAAIVTTYKYNQNESIGHGVKSGLVNVYHCSCNDLDETRERLGISNIRDLYRRRVKYCVYLSALEFIILKDASEDNKYVICTDDMYLYDAVHYFLKTSLLDWTISIKEFMKTKSIFTVLLTDYAAVRGYEFSNFIFLSPLGKTFLKYRMLECFTRCTTRLHIISGKMNVTNDSIDYQLLNKWKELNCVYFVDCSYDKSADKVFLVHNDTEIYCKENAKEIYREPSKTSYPWKHAFKVEDVDVTILQDAISIGLRCVITMDNIRLFNDFINLHNIDIYTYRTIDDYNLLHIASEYDAVSISQILINDYKIDANLTGRSKKTPLHLAACCGSLNCTDTLLKNGADVNAKNEGDETPLHNSSYTGYINIVRLLLDNGADVNVKDKKGGTPLHKSADKGFINIAQVLLNNGADVNVKNKYGNTAINLAEIFLHHDIVELLKC